jgi:excisionase family DNA binding protein
MENDVIRVSVSEASRLFGVDQKTIRRALNDQELKYIVVRGRYKIKFYSIL